MARVDPRLTLAAAGVWAAAAVAGGWTAATDVRMTIALAVGLAAAVAVRRRPAVSWVACGAVLGAASATVHVWLVHTGPVADLAAHHGHGVVQMRIVRDPLVRSPPHGPPFTLIDATVTAVGNRGVDAPVLVFAHGRAWESLLPGQRVRVGARFVPPRAGDTVSAVVLVSRRPDLLGQPPWWQRVAGAIRAHLRAACAGLPSDERGLVPGLVIGDVSRMPPSLTDAFRVSGLTHLNAVSGENCAVMLGAVVFGVRRAGLGRRARVVVCAAALVAFVVVARPSPSVLRATAMGAAALAAVALGRRPQPLPLLSLAVVGLVLVDPFLARQVGFALSVAATAAILLLAPPLTRRFARRLPRPVAAAVAVSIAAQVACTPLLVAVFGQLTPWAVPANLLAAPAVAPATLLGIAAAVTALPLPGLGALFAWAAAVPAGWLAVVARVMAALPGAGIRGPTGWRGVMLVAVAGVVAAFAWRLRHTSRRAMLGAWQA